MKPLSEEAPRLLVIQNSDPDPDPDPSSVQLKMNYYAILLVATK